MRRFGVTVVACAAAWGALLPLGSAEAITGDVIVTDFSAFADGKGGLIGVNTNTGVRRTISENAKPIGDPTFFSPIGLAQSNAGDLIVSHAFQGGVPFLAAGPAAVVEGVITVNQATGARTPLSLTDPVAQVPPSNAVLFGNPAGITVEDSTGDVLVADNTLKAIVRVQAGSGVRSVLSSNATPGQGTSFSEPYDVDVAPNGDIVVADRTKLCATPAAGGSRCGAIIRVDPTTGVRSILSSNKVLPPGPVRSQFDDPTGLAIDTSGNIIVANHRSNKILTVNPSTGAKSLLSDNSSPGTPAFEGPWDLVASSSDFPIFVTDYEPASATHVPKVLSVDPGSGAHGHVSDNANPIGTTNFASPWGIVYEPNVVTAARIQPPSFQPGTSGNPNGVVGAAAARGAAFSYRLRERARMTFTLFRRDPGRIVGSRCRRETRRNRGGRRCVVWARVGSFSHRGRAGTNTVRFSGRVGRSALRAARYRARLVALNSKGVPSAPVSVGFRIRRG